MHFVNISKEELKILKLYKSPNKWDDWRELSPKLRYLLQRMILSSGLSKHAIVMDIAKDASHRAGRHKWCEDCEPSTEELIKQIF